MSLIYQLQRQAMAPQDSSFFGTIVARQAKKKASDYVIIKSTETNHTHRYVYTGQKAPLHKLICTSGRLVSHAICRTTNTGTHHQSCGCADHKVEFKQLLNVRCCIRGCINDYVGRDFTIPLSLNFVYVLYITSSCAINYHTL